MTHPVSHIGTTDLEGSSPLGTSLVLQPHMLPSGLVTRFLETAALPWGPPDMSARLIRAALLSVSLSLAEKDALLTHMPTLGQWQVDELLKCFDDERAEFSRCAVIEPRQVAELQARSLWGVLALAANRCGTSPALERAWLRRIVRQGARAGLTVWLDRLPEPWWREHAVVRWAFRPLYPGCHPAWLD